MNELALFAGCGGGILASNLIGNRVVCAVERDEYCQHVLVQRQNDKLLEPFPIWDDICTFRGGLWRGSVDVVSGGFPCQAFSKAAHGNNLAEKNLWGQMRRVIGEVCPEYVFAENVSEKAITQAKYDLETDGYRCEFIKLSAKDLGADHIRDRYWLLAHSNMHSKLRGEVYAETQRMQEFRNSVWETFPGELRVPDGVAYRMDRLKAVGNGQVPAVAAIAYLTLMNKLKEKQ